ncbi:MAG: hypothetical protein U5O16_39065 [Rhodococcus sp. (in: high G+C Gram-positive bacteria)]|uniref:hypothetical protein n=1 Tax=Rhodococcus sp. TaxID=1831 RepID=UPI00105B6EDB|nr:hypothetical protein [Rhodococcus sp. (in: high G+C Gram-positive bacteria)]
MDVGSLMDALGSVDAGSLVDPVNAVGALFNSFFPVVTALIDLVVSGFTASAGSAQNVLGSVSGL